MDWEWKLTSEYMRILFAKLSHSEGTVSAFKIPRRKGGFRLIRAVNMFAR